MSVTKKMLVAFDPGRPDTRSSEFLIPWNWEGRRVLRGLKSARESGFGMVVFVGRSVTENDLFAKLVDSGTIIANVDDTLALLRSFLDGLQCWKIGNVVQIRSTSQNVGSDVELELVANTPSAVKN